MKAKLRFVVLAGTLGLALGLSAAALKPIAFRAGELGGEFDRRVWAVATNHYLKISVDRFCSPFEHRESNPRPGRYVGCGKLLDAGVKLSVYTGDARVRERTRLVFERIAATQDADGYLGFWQRTANEGQFYANWLCHEMEYMLLAFCSYARAFGDAKARAAAVRLGDYLYRTYPRDERTAKLLLCGYAEAFVELARLTGERKYLEYAATIPWAGPPFGPNQPLRGWKQNFREWNGNHAYTCLARAFAATEIAHDTGETDILAMPRELLSYLAEPGRDMLLVTGGCSQGEHLSRSQGGTGECAESCATAYLVKELDSMMCLDGDFRHGDIVECAVWNSLFGAGSPDGRKIRYHTAMTGARVWDQHNDGYCCCGNFRRAIGDLPTRVAFETADSGLAVVQYVPFDKVFELGGRRFRLACRTRYPADGAAEYVFGDDATVNLSFRKPSWCEGFRVTGLKPSYRKGDVVRVELPMKWRVDVGSGNQTGRVVVRRGPLVFCAGTARNPDLAAATADFRTLALEPDSVTGPYPDATVRPDGICARARMRTRDGRIFAVTLTEFADPSGLETYFMPGGPPARRPSATGSTGAPTARTPR